MSKFLKYGVFLLFTFAANASARQAVSKVQNSGKEPIVDPVIAPDWRAFLPTDVQLDTISKGDLNKDNLEEMAIVYHKRKLRSVHGTFYAQYDSFSNAPMKAINSLQKAIRL